MTFQLVTRYCAKCRTGTPFEYDTETEKGRCTICADKQIRRHAQRKLASADPQDEVAAFRAALEPRGERRRK